MLEASRWTVVSRIAIGVSDLVVEVLSTVRFADDHVQEVVEASKASRGRPGEHKACHAFDELVVAGTGARYRRILAQEYRTEKTGSC